MTSQHNVTAHPEPRRAYMLGRRKRCLILKEQRLPDLPADVVHRLYKTFDMFNVSASVAREVARWVDVDLGVGAIGAP